MLEAKSRMSYYEAMRWSSYFAKNGYPSTTKGVVPHVQQGFALLASILINVNGGYQGGKKAKLEDFLPGKGEDAEGSVEEVAALLSSLWSPVGGRPKKEASRKIWRRKEK